MSEIKTTVKEILESEKAMSNIFSKEIPTKLAYRSIKLLKKIKRELRDFYEAKQEIVDAKQDAIDESTLEGRREMEKVKKEITKELKDIIKNEVVINEEKIPFALIKDLSVAPYDLADIDWMISEASSEDLVIEEKKN
jgi:hypothetical protein